MNLAKDLPVNEGEPLELVRLLENRLPAMARRDALRASRAEIREKIRSVSDPLAQAIDALEDLERICSAENASLVDRSAYFDIRWVDGVEMLMIVRKLHAICLEAERCRTEQARSKSKMLTQPMWLIARTLGLDTHPVDLGDGFISIVEICYRAAGLCSESEHVDLSRHIKKFMTERREAMERLTTAQPDRTETA